MISITRKIKLKLPLIPFNEAELNSTLKGERENPVVQAIFHLLEDAAAEAQSVAMVAYMPDAETKWWLGQATALMVFKQDLLEKMGDYVDE